ncbi:MAG: MarR family transcriptional regulator [Candidatus Hodarchaeota archaeon]
MSSIQLEEQLSRIERLLKVTRQESCLSLYSYLMVFGKTTPADLREKIGISKATIFRNLALLSESGIIDKEEDPTITDRRYNLHYYISEDLMELSKQICCSHDLIEHAKEKNKAQLVIEWINTIETIPLTLNRFTSQHILSMRHQTSNGSPESCEKVGKLMMFRLTDAEFNKLFEKVAAFVKELDSEQPGEARDWKKPLQRPATIALSLVALNPDKKCGNGCIVVKREKIDSRSP